LSAKGARKGHVTINPGFRAEKRVFVTIEPDLVTIEPDLVTIEPVFPDFRYNKPRKRQFRA